MNNIYEILTEVEKEKGIKKDILINIMKEELIKAYKNYYKAEKVDVIIDSKEAKLVVTKRVSKSSEKKDINSINLPEARKIDPSCKIGDFIDIKIDIKKLTPSVVIAAKQQVIKRIKQIEKELLIKEFTPKVNNIITGRVQKIGRTILVDLGKVEGILPYNQQVRREQFKIGDRIRSYVLEIKEKEDTIQVILSRSSEELVRLLFHQEIPEINKGIIDIKKVVREAGLRTKVVVASKDKNIDPVGTCIGIRGTRIQAIMNELNGERIDVISFTDDIKELIKMSMVPAKVNDVIIEDNNNATVVVPENQLSLAIGKYGHNIRLVGKLVGLSLKVKTENEIAKEKIKAELFVNNK